MRLSLVFPRMKYKSGDPPAGLALLATIVRQSGHEVDLVDATFHSSVDYIKERLRSFKPDFVCIYIDSLSFDAAIEVAKYSKKLKKKVIFGGPHATLKPKSISKFADYVVVGEADDAIVDIIEGKYKNKIIEPKRPDLTNTPIPAYDLLEMEKYMHLWHSLDAVDPNLRGTSMITSRGCPFKCTFCQPVLDSIFGKGVRSRSVDSVIAEIKYLKENYNIDGVFFHDDTFTVRKKWVLEFCQRLLDEKINVLWGINSRVDLMDEDLLKRMHEAGLRVMHIGIETGCQRVADEIYHKGIDLSKVPKTISAAEKIGVRCLCFFMLGAPGETEEEILQTIKFAKSLDATEITATISTPLPGTYLHQSIKDQYNVTKDFGNFDYYKNSAFDNPDVSFKKLKWLQKRLLLEFYTHPKRWPYILKHIFSIRGLHKMYLKITRFL